MKNPTAATCITWHENIEAVNTRDARHLNSAISSDLRVLWRALQDWSVRLFARHKFKTRHGSAKQRPTLDALSSAPLTAAALSHAPTTKLKIPYNPLHPASSRMVQCARKNSSNSCFFFYAQKTVIWVHVAEVSRYETLSMNWCYLMWFICSENLWNKETMEYYFSISWTYESLIPHQHTISTHLILFINTLNWLNVFGQKFLVNSFCHGRCWFLYWYNVDVGIPVTFSSSGKNETEHKYEFEPRSKNKKVSAVQHNFRDAEWTQSD